MPCLPQGFGVDPSTPFLSIRIQM